MIALVEGAARQRTPNEIALSVLLTSLTIVFLIAVATLQPLAGYSGQLQPLIILIALLVCLIPTTIGALLSAIGIAGMDRLVQRNVLAMSGRRGGRGRREHAPARQDRHHHARQPPGGRAAPRSRGHSPRTLAAAARRSSLADETPEGRSIVVLAEQQLTQGGATIEPADPAAEFVAFSAETRMSGLDAGGVRTRKGAGDAITRWLAEAGGAMPAEVQEAANDVARRGGTPLVVAEQGTDGAARARSASCTSRMSSSRACASASRSCGAWASRP